MELAALGYEALGSPMREYSPAPTQPQRQRCRLGEHNPRPGGDGLGAVQILLRWPSQVIPGEFHSRAGVFAGVGCEAPEKVKAR